MEHSVLEYMITPIVWEIVFNGIYTIVKVFDGADTYAHVLGKPRGASDVRNPIVILFKRVHFFEILDEILKPGVIFGGKVAIEFLHAIRNVIGKSFEIICANKTLVK